MRDYRRLRTVVLADELIVQAYTATAGLPVEERYGLQTQIRRAAISVPTIIVEGSARRTTREYVQFLLMAFGSAVEVVYLLGVCRRLGYVNDQEIGVLWERYDHLVRMLRRQTDALSETVSDTDQRPASKHRADTARREPWAGREP